MRIGRKRNQGSGEPEALTQWCAPGGAETRLSAATAMYRQARRDRALTGSGAYPASFVPSGVSFAMLARNSSRLSLKRDVMSLVVSSWVLFTI